MSHIKIDNQKVWRIVIIILFFFFAFITMMSRPRTPWPQVGEILLTYMLVIGLPVIIVVAILLYKFNRPPKA